MELVIYGLSLPLFIFGLVAGLITEQRHFADLARRESELASIVATNLKKLGAHGVVLESRIAIGSVVVSTDYFKSICASVRRLVGGRIYSYESLVERARREALLRLKAQAAAMGATVVLNVRYETMPVARTKNGAGVTGIEVLAYGTALRMGE